MKLLFQEIYSRWFTVSLTLCTAWWLNKSCKTLMQACMGCGINAMDGACIAAKMRDRVLGQQRQA